MKNNFEGTTRLIRFVLRRERLASSLWIILLSAFSIVLAPGLAKMFDPPARQALTLTVNNPGMIAMMGPVYGIENYTAGAMYFNMMVQWIMLTAAVMGILLVIRHTRNDEELGRLDLLRSAPTGRFAPLGSVMIVAFLVSAAIAILTGIGIGVCGVEDMGWNGSMLYGAAIGSAAFVFAAMAAVFSQLCKTSRGAIGMSIAALGGLYLLRAAGDVGNEVLAYISPLGLAHRTKAFTENNWYPIPILLAEALVFIAIAAALNNFRDLRQGLLPERKGKDHAGLFLRTPFGLAFRLLRMPFWGWAFGMYLLGASYGSILGTIDIFVQSSEFYSMVIGARPGYSTAQMFVAMVTSMMALCAVLPVLTMMLRIRTEENRSYFQNVLSAAVSKYRYFASYLVIAVISAVVMEIAAALGIYSSALAVLDDPGTLPLGHLLLSNLVYVPALWVMLGLCAVLIAVAPRLVNLIWLYFGFSFFATFMGRIPGMIPDWVRKLTPYAFIPVLPVDEINWVTLIVLTGMAAALMAAAFAAYRKRDISAA